MIATITPNLVAGGLTQIGGFITIFGLLKIALYHYNKRSFERSIFKRYEKQINEICWEDHIEQDSGKSPIQSYLKSRGKKEMDLKTVRDLLSYEMFMKLVMQHLTLEKNKRISTKRDNKRIINNSNTILTVKDGDQGLEKRGRLL